MLPQSQIISRVGAWCPRAKKKKRVLCQAEFPLLSIPWVFSKLVTLPFPGSPCKEAGCYARPEGILK